MASTVLHTIFQKCMILYLISLVGLVGEVKRGVCVCCALEWECCAKGLLNTPLNNSRSGLTVSGPWEPWQTSGCFGLAGTRSYQSLLRPSLLGGIVEDSWLLWWALSGKEVLLFCLVAPHPGSLWVWKKKTFCGQELGDLSSSPPSSAAYLLCDPAKWFNLSEPQFPHLGWG